MHGYRARWVLPIVSPPIPDGVLVVAEGRVLYVGPTEELPPELRGVSLEELGDAVILPGLVNAHTHLGLTGEAGRHPSGAGLFAWLMSLLPAVAARSEEDLVAAAAQGLAESHALGTDLVGDIVSHPATVRAHRADPRGRARIFFEILGVREESARRSYARAREQADALRAENDVADRLRPGLSPHAPYSVWPALWHEAARWCEEHRLPWTSHVAEAAEEAEFLRAGTGPLRAYLEWLGVWDGSFPHPGRTGARFLDEADLLDEHALLVHGVHLDAHEIHRLAVSEAAVCLCPRSNLYLGLPPPPARALWEQGAFLCLGTDSKASNEDLGIWGELRAMAAIAPEIPAEYLLRMATSNGAVALGFSGEAGVLYPGCPARPIAVGAPDLGGDDPAAYLVRERVEPRVRALEAG